MKPDWEDSTEPSDTGVQAPDPKTEWPATLGPEFTEQQEWEEQS